MRNEEKICGIYCSLENKTKIKILKKIRPHIKDERESTKIKCAELIKNWSVFYYV